MILNLVWTIGIHCLTSMTMFLKPPSCINLIVDMYSVDIHPLSHATERDLALESSNHLVSILVLLSATDHLFVDYAIASSSCLFEFVSYFTFLTKLGQFTAAILIQHIHIRNFYAPP